MPAPASPGHTYTRLASASLAQAVRWVAFGLPPLEDRFERLEEYPIVTGTGVPNSRVDDDPDDWEIPEAKRKIARALMLGKLVAKGRKNGTGYHRNTDPSDKNFNKMVLDYDIEPSDIPANFWLPGIIEWQGGRAIYPRSDISLGKIYDEEDPPVMYKDISVLTSDLTRLFPRAPGIGSLEAADPSQTGGKRGRKPTYDKADFFIICALDASLNGLRDKQADFIERTSQLLGILWGEANVPSETWLKARYAELHRMKNDYEHARQSIDGHGIAD